MDNTEQRRELKSAKQVRAWALHPRFVPGTVAAGWAPMPPIAQGLTVTLVIDDDGKPRVNVYDYVAGLEVSEITIPNRAGFVFPHEYFYAALSPDKKRSLWLKWERGWYVLHLWDAQTDRIVRTFRVHQEEHYRVRWMPDSRRFITTARDAKVRIWDADAPPGSSGLIACLDNGTHASQALDVFPDGKRFVTATGQGRLRVWDSDTGTVVVETDRVTDPHYRQIDGDIFENPLSQQSCFSNRENATVPAGYYYTAVSPNNRWLFGGASDGIACVFDSESGRLQAEHHEKNGFQDHVVNGAFSPDGDLVVFSTRRGSVRVWDWQAGRIITCIEGTREVGWKALAREPISFIAFDPDGKHVIAAGDDGIFRRWALTE